MIWAILTIMGLLVLVAWQHQRFKSVQRENAAWRKLAKERADRVTTLSHEIRMPLSLVRGAAEVLDENAAGSLTKVQTELVQTISVNAHHVQSLASDLLTEAKMEAGLWQLHFEAIDVGRLVRRVVKDMRTLTGTPIELHSPRRPMLIVGDRKLLRQVFVNLVNNAVKHAGPDATIMVETFPFEDSVLVSVSDDGAGISDDSRRELLMQRFEGKSQTGYGLGLAISRRIVALHGGHCLIDSVLSKGTAILVSLPKGEVVESAAGEVTGS